MRRTEEENKRRNNREKVETKIESGLKKYYNKLKSIKLDKKKIITLLIFVLFGICVIIVNNYIELGIVINKNIASEDTVQLQLQESIEQVLPFGNEVLVYSKGKIEIYNNHGKKTSTIELVDGVDAEVSTSGEYIQVVNKDKKTVYVYRNKYEVARIKIDGEIRSANINKNGTSVIEYYSNRNKVILGVYNNSGDLKYNIKPNNNIIGKYVLSDNSKYLAYTDVDISGISAYTNINFIDLTNVNENESNASIIYTLDNALAYDIRWEGKDVIVRFDDSYIIYNISSKKTNTIKISDGQVLNIGDYAKRFAYTELDGEGNYLLVIRKMLGDKLKRVELHDTPKYIEYENGVVYVCYSKKIEAYNNSGVNVKNYNSDMVITKPVMFNDGRSLAMAISNKLIMFTI